MKYLELQDPERAYILDIESDSLQPTVIWCAVLKRISDGEVLVFENKEDFNTFHKEDHVYIGHNILSFDVPVLNRLWATKIDLNRCVCTLTLSYLYNPALWIPDGYTGSKGPHSLDVWGYRLGLPKGDFSDFSRYTPEMLSYCKQDVEVTYKLYHELTKKMLKIGYTEKSAEIEHRIHVIIDEQQENGCWFDEARAKDFLTFLQREQSDLAVRIRKLFPPRRSKVAEYTLRRRKDGSPNSHYENHRIKYPDIVEYTDQGVEKYDCYELVPFNFGSPAQRLQRLLELGWTPTEFTEKGNPKTGEDQILKFAETQGDPALVALAEYLVCKARISTLQGDGKKSFGQLGAVRSGRIHGRVLSCGATSRRMIHSNPQTANIPNPKKAKYGKEMRSFWSVEPDKGLCMVGYDAKGLETECFKHWLNSSAANKILDGDIHTDNAKALSELIGRDVDREWGAKTSWYAWMFGCYPPKIATILKCDIKFAEKIFEEVYPNRIPGLKKFIESIQYEWKTNKGRLSCIDGGYVVCPSKSAALNYKIQPTGAVVMKLSSIIIKDDTTSAGVWNRKLLDVHDEGQHEVLEKEIYIGTEVNKKGQVVEIKRHPFGDIVVEAIRKAGRELRMNVPLDGSYAVGQDWSCTH